MRLSLLLRRYDAVDEYITISYFSTSNFIFKMDSSPQYIYIYIYIRGGDGTSATRARHDQ